MKVTQERLPQSQVQLEIQVPAEKSQQVYEQVVRSLIQNVKLPGFRQGKIPQKVLLQRLGESRIKANTLEKLLEDSLREAITQEKVIPISEYELGSTMDDLLTTFAPGKTLTFTVKFDVLPEVKLGEYKGLKIQVEELIAKDSDIDDFLEEKRREHAPLVPVENRPAQKGDVVIVDYAGYLEGEETPIPGGEAQDFQLELEQGHFIEELVEGIIGMETGATKKVPVKFPEDYPREDIAGKSAEFTITLKEIKEKELPELDDDFAQDFSAYETLAELREVVQKKYEDEALKGMEEAKRNAIAVELGKLVEVELPESMIAQETGVLVNRAAAQLERMGMDINRFMNEELLIEMRKRSRPEAIANLQQTLALLEVAKQESLQPTEEEVIEVANTYAKEMKGQNIDMTRLRAFVQEDLTKDKAMEWLVAHAEVELVPEGSLEVATEEESEEEIQEELPKELEESAAEIAARVEDAEDKTVEVPAVAVEE
jgi:trigger factor